jgi:glycosyltransferase involved in cell wall biosynthesis
VNRFQDQQNRNPEQFGKIQKYIFECEHSIEEELNWLDEEGPMIPGLIKELGNRENEFDYFIFFSYRYYHSFHGISRFRKKSILVPTAEHDDVIYLRLFKDLFNLPGAIVYNSHEEKAMINRISGNDSVIGDIVGVGSEIPASFSPRTFREKFNIQGHYFIYIGRLDENKGVPELLSFYLKFLNETKVDFTLVLMGKSLIEIPDHLNIRYLGFVTDREKFDGLKGSDFLIIPSQFESLSMVALEAWAIGKPVVANGRTEVLQGQCQRSNAGLWYTNYEEFKSIILLLQQNPSLRSNLGENGIRFFQNNYSWPVIEDKYRRIIGRLDIAKSGHC